MSLAGRPVSPLAGADPAVPPGRSGCSSRAPRPHLASPLPYSLPRSSPNLSAPLQWRFPLEQGGRRGCWRSTFTRPPPRPLPCRPPCPGDRRLLETTTTHGRTHRVGLVGRGPPQILQKMLTTPILGQRLRSCERQMCWASEVTTRSTLGICTDRFQPVNVRPKHAAHHRYFPARIVASTHACIHASKSIGTSSLLFSARIADLHLIELQKLKRSEYTKT
jgi:hypothetical protein